MEIPSEKKTRAVILGTTKKTGIAKFWVFGHSEGCLLTGLLKVAKKL